MDSFPLVQSQFLFSYKMVRKLWEIKSVNKFNGALIRNNNIKMREEEHT